MPGVRAASRVRGSKAIPRPRIVVLILALLVGPASVCAQDADVMYAHFINVGQADCTLLEFPCGAILIDAGVETNAYEDALIAYLEDFFARRADLDRKIACLFVTHQHTDHTRALPSVVEQFTVERCIENGERTGGGAADITWLRGEIEAGRQDTVMRIVRDADVVSSTDVLGLTDDVIDPIECDSCDPVIHVVSGGLDTNPGWPEGDFHNPNNQSLVIRVDFGQASLLFTGDLEDYAIHTLVEYYANTDTLDVDVYQVGHHGSENATTEDLLAAMTPYIAVVSMGFWSEGRMPSGTARPLSAFGYGHPRKEALELLAEQVPGFRSRRIQVMAGLASKQFERYEVRRRIYGTGWEGTIKVRATLDRKYRVTAGN